MKRLFILAVFFTSTVFGQKYELGKVTVEELQEKACSIDTSAVAAVLFRKGEVKFNFSQNNGFEIVTTVKTKIKIYKEEGYDWANKVVRYYSDGNFKEKVSFNDVASYNLVNDKIVKTKLKSDGEFDEKINKFWGSKKITLPNVKVGTIIEFEYSIISPNFSKLENWSFQEKIPVMYSEFITYIPEYFSYRNQLRGYLTPTITNDLNIRTISIDSKERQVGNGSFSPPRTIYNKDNIDFKEKKTVYTLSKIEALKDETFVNNLKNYISSVEHELESIQYPNQPFKNFSTDWETVTKNIYDNESFGQELNKTGYFEKDIDELISGKNDFFEKAALIFNFVKTNMNWNEFYGYGCDVGVRKAYQDKVGNSAEINLMLTAMLRYAGIDANPIIISTRGNGISFFPSRTAFDYVISGIELENNIILLDATNKYSLPNILPIRDLNWIGRIIRKSGSSSPINLMPKKNSIDAVNLIASINSEGEVSGKIREQYFDYNAFIFRNSYNGVSKDSYVEKLEKRHSGLEITDYDVQNSSDLSKPIIESYSFTNNNVSEIIGDKMYISPLLYFTTTENPFKQETREYPVDFVYPHQDKYNISLTIPDGYTIETLPQPSAMAMPDGLGKFSYNISKNNNQIQLLYSLDINQAIISPEYYDALKNLYKEIVNKQTEKIVLKKG
ncbi:MAG: transglutaminase [Flavobacteriaceae bacterium]|nr:MAG: transglutaminase [Flavobacteriaceae bacterium]